MRKRACSAIPRSLLWNKRLEIMFNPSTVVFYEIPVTTLKQTIDLYISIEW